MSLEDDAKPVRNRGHHFAAPINRPQEARSAPLRGVGLTVAVEEADA